MVKKTQSTQVMTNERVGANIPPLLCQENWGKDDETVWFQGLISAHSLHS